MLDRELDTTSWWIPQRVKTALVKHVQIGTCRMSLLGTLVIVSICSYVQKYGAYVYV